MKTTKRDLPSVEMIIGLWICGVVATAITDHCMSGLLFGYNVFIHVVVGVTGSSMLIWIPLLFVRLFRAPAAWRAADEASRRSLSEHLLRAKGKNEGRPPSDK